VLLTAAVPWPTVFVRFVVTTTAFRDEHFVAGYSAPFGRSRVFGLCFAAALAAVLVDMTYLISASARGKRVAEACVAALGAVAIYAALGGCVFTTVLLVALLAFTAALSDGAFVLVLSLTTTLWDTCFATGPQGTARAVAAVSYAAYAFVAESVRSRPDNLATVVGAAGRATALWQAYAVLAGMGDTGVHPALYVATVVPLFAVLGYFFIARHSAAPDAWVSTPAAAERHRRSKKKHHVRSDFGGVRV
jgi:hypothetical protein